jgi:hypothetical protein
MKVNCVAAASSAPEINVFAAKVWGILVSGAKGESVCTSACKALYIKKCSLI